MLYACVYLRVVGNGGRPYKRQTNDNIKQKHKTEWQD